MGFLNDIVNGSEKKIKADPLAKDVNAAGKTGLGLLTSGASKLNDIYNQDPSNVVNSQIEIENKLMRGAADDATRRTRDLIAQRGLGSSSIGLGQEVNQHKTLLDKLSMNNASGFSRLRDMGLQNAQGIMNTGSALFAPKSAQGPMQMTDTTYRTGGYGQLLGAGIQAAGSYLGAKKSAPSENAVAMNYNKGQYEGYA
jgi:hypothetical protein